MIRSDVGERSRSEGGSPANAAVLPVPRVSKILVAQLLLVLMTAR